MKSVKAFWYNIPSFMFLKAVDAWLDENTPATFDQAQDFLAEYEADIIAAVGAVGAPVDDITA